MFHYRPLTGSNIWLIKSWHFRRPWVTLKLIQILWTLSVWFFVQFDTVFNTRFSEVVGLLKEVGFWSTLELSFGDEGRVLMLQLTRCQLTVLHGSLETAELLALPYLRGGWVLATQRWGHNRIGPMRIKLSFLFWFMAKWPLFCSVCWFVCLFVCLFV